MTKDVLINAGGNYINVAFTALYTFFLVRILTPEQYGIFSVLFSIVFVCTNIFDFGITASIYATVPPLLQTRAELYSFIKTNFLYQTILSLIALTIGFLFVNQLNTQVLKLNVSMMHYLVTGATIIGFVWQNFVLNILYASGKFLKANIIVNSANLVKIAAMGITYIFGYTSVPVMIVVLGLLGPVTVLVGVVVTYTNSLKELAKVRTEKSNLKFGYSLTYLIATQFYNISTRVDVFMLSYFLTKVEVGYYAVAQKIVMVVITAVNSITQVLSPQFSTHAEKKNIFGLLKKSYLFMTIPIVALIAVSLTPHIFFTWFFTKSFEQAIGITRQLSLVYCLFAVSVVPTLFFLYTIKKPIYVLIGNGLLLTIIAVANWQLIPVIGIHAPVQAVLWGYSATTVFFLSAFYYEYRKL